MKRLLILVLAVIFSGCSSLPARSPTPLQCKLPQESWPVHPQHFYDGEIHLVPSFSKAPKDYKSPNFMTGYRIVFVKSDSMYKKLGLNTGDVIQSLDDLQFDKTVAPDTFLRIKTGQYKVLKIERCLELR